MTIDLYIYRGLLLLVFLVWKTLLRHTISLFLFSVTKHITLSCVSQALFNLKCNKLASKKSSKGSKSQKLHLSLFMTLLKGVEIQWLQAALMKQMQSEYALEMPLEIKNMRNNFGCISSNMKIQWQKMRRTKAIQKMARAMQKTTWISKTK